MNDIRSHEVNWRGRKGRRFKGHAVSSFVLAMALVMSPAGKVAGAPELDDEGAVSMRLRFPADDMEILPDGRRVLLVGRESGEIDIFDYYETNLEPLGRLRQMISDIAVSTDGNYAYFVGSDSTRGATLLTRLTIADGSADVVRVDPGLTDPSLAIGGDGRLYLAALTLGKWRLIELGQPTDVFERGILSLSEGRPRMRSWPVRPTTDLVAFPQGLLLVQFETGSVSAFDTDSGVELDSLVLGGGPKLGSGYPVDAVFAGTPAESLDGGSIIIGDPAGNRVVFATYDPLFRDLEVLQTVRTNLVTTDFRSSVGGELDVPFVVASDSAQRFVVVGSRLDRRVIVLRRVGRAVELVREMQLPTAPVDLDVSSSGHLAAALTDRGHSLTRFRLEGVIGEPSGASEEGIVMQLQRNLSSLGYSVGPVDGVEGPATRAAISRFEAEEGLSMVARSSAAVLDQVREVVKEQIAELTRDLNSPEAVDRKRSVALLTERHVSDVALVDAALEWLEPPKLEDLTAEGRVNVLTVLTNTDPNIWTAEFVKRGQAAIDRLETRHREGVAEVGPQTRALMLDFVAFLKTTAFSGLEEASPFRDRLADGSNCPYCPEILVVPAGEFIMGSPPDEPGRKKDEGPQRQVTISKPFAVGKYEVTFNQWAACVEGGGCARRPPDEGWGRGNRPVINVSWDDTQEYVHWLGVQTGKNYRLLTEAEWEYAARGNTDTPYWWGAHVGSGNANCQGCGSQWDDKLTAPVGQFDPNPFGLYDAGGNVREWVQDCWHRGYDGAPTDGSAWAVGSCNRRVNRDGSWQDNRNFLRSAARDSNKASDGSPRRGFRIARDLMQDEVSRIVR